MLAKERLGRLTGSGRPSESGLVLKGNYFLKARNSMKFENRRERESEVGRMVELLKWKEMLANIFHCIQEKRSEMLMRRLDPLNRIKKFEKKWYHVIQHVIYKDLSPWYFLFQEINLIHNPLDEFLMSWVLSRAILK